ncbi:hypothetical protein E2K66_22795 [Escherichia coli]|nr:hypothetical protein E2K66_22795 [Escherichia coli]
MTRLAEILDQMSAVLNDLKTVMDQEQQQQHKEKCLMVAMLASAGLGEVAQYESARAELTAINPAWPKAALFTTVMPFIFNYVH